LKKAVKALKQTDGIVEQATKPSKTRRRWWTGGFFNDPQTESRWLRRLSSCGAG
jgi:hypothetical protein